MRIFLAWRGPIEVKTGRAGKFRQRIGLGRVKPMSATIDRHAKGLRIGDAASADVVGRFQQHDAALGSEDMTGRGDAGDAGADHHDIDVVRLLRQRECRRGHRRSGTGKK